MTLTMPEWFVLICVVFGVLALFALLYPFFRDIETRPIEWVMHLEDDPMELIKRGLKVFEFRLDKPKWKNIQKGDIVEFQSMDGLRFVRVEILETVRFPQFEELLRYCEHRDLLEKPYDIQLASLKIRYSEAERKKYGRVFGFHFELLGMVS